MPLARQTRASNVSCVCDHVINRMVRDTHISSLDSALYPILVSQWLFSRFLPNNVLLCIPQLWQNHSFNSLPIPIWSAISVTTTSRVSLHGSPCVMRWQVRRESQTNKVQTLSTTDRVTWTTSIRRLKIGCVRGLSLHSHCTRHLTGITSWVAEAWGATHSSQPNHALNQ